MEDRGHTRPARAPALCRDVAACPAAAAGEMDVVGPGPGAMGEDDSFGPALG